MSRGHPTLFKAERVWKPYGLSCFAITRLLSARILRQAQRVISSSQSKQVPHWRLSCGSRVLLLVEV